MGLVNFKSQKGILKAWQQPNKNKYSKGTHIAERKFRQVIKCFPLDLNAYKTSKIRNISHTTYKKLFQKLRIYIYKNLLENKIYDVEFELDESYFVEKRVRGARRSWGRRRDW